MILEDVITRKEHGLFNRVFVSGFIHKFSGVKSLMEKITEYSTENGLSFSERALKIYQEKVEEEIREISGRPMNINNLVQGDLMYIERFLINSGLIKDPRFESHLNGDSHLEGESHNMYNYAREKGFNPDVLIEVLKEEGYSTKYVIRGFVDLFSRGKGYMVEVYRSPKTHMKNTRLLNALEKYLLRTGVITEEDIKINEWIHDLKNFGGEFSRFRTELSRRQSVGYLIKRIKKFSDENPSENPVAEFYKALMNGNATLLTSRGKKRFSSKELLEEYIGLKFPELKIN